MKEIAETSTHVKTAGIQFSALGKYIPIDIKKEVTLLNIRSLGSV
jgi:hypothetical protein